MNMTDSNHYYLVNQIYVNRVSQLQKKKRTSLVPVAQEGAREISLISRKHRALKIGPKFGPLFFPTISFYGPCARDRADFTSSTGTN